jgi:Kef-type K+ transport system membrane component KefB
MPIDASLALDGLMSLSVIFLLLVVGMEIELKEISKQGKAVVRLGAMGIIIPSLMGAGVGWLIYDGSITGLLIKYYPSLRQASLFIHFENLVIGSIIYRTTNSKHFVSRFFNPPCP